MKHLVRYAAIGAMAALALAGCHAPASGRNGSAAMELKIYDVPPEQTTQLASTLNNVLGKGENVTAPVPGKLLVYAPDTTQSSIARTLDVLGKAASAPAAPTQLVVRFWVIDGVPGTGEDDPALKDLTGSLASLRQTMGPLHFRLNQIASLVDGGTGQSELNTSDAPSMRNFIARVGSVRGDSARLELSYQDSAMAGLRGLHTEIDTAFGQYIVLAQAPGICPATPNGLPASANCPDKPALRLLVVRVDRLPTKA